MMTEEELLKIEKLLAEVQASLPLTEPDNLGGCGDPEHCSTGWRISEDLHWTDLEQVEDLVNEVPKLFREIYRLKTLVSTLVVKNTDLWKENNELKARCGE